MPQPSAAVLPELEAPWTPDLTPKQFDIINDRHKQTLVCGPMMTGKSLGICHKVVRHLWDTENAYFGIFVTSYKVATDGGSWTDLIHVVRQWIEAGIEGDDGPMEFTSFLRGDDEGGPKLDAKSRTPFFRIKNRYGGDSECRLFSVDNENEIEAKVKGLRLSGVWVVELSTFKTRAIMDLTIGRLRALGVAYEDMFWIADTNPAKEGKEHWAYKIFYQDRVDPDYADKAFQSEIGLIEIFLDDNPKLDPRDRRRLENTYRDSPEEFDRFVLGKWPESSSAGLSVFADLLTPLHFPEGKIDVDRLSEVLATGWDMGLVNSAAVIIEPRLVDGVQCIMALDELVYTATEITTQQFAQEMMDKMIALNNFYKAHWGAMFPGFSWRHWSDNSATTVWRPQVGDFDAGVVYKATDGQIELVGVDKPDGSVAEDTKMTRMLLREGRLFVGANCPWLIRCLKELKKGPNQVIRRDDPLKHIFDAFRYAVRSEWLDNYRSEDASAAPKGGVVRVPMR